MTEECGRKGATRLFVLAAILIFLSGCIVGGAVAWIVTIVSMTVGNNAAPMAFPLA